MIAAEQHAARIVLPASQRTYRTQWGSHKDLAAKALRKLAARHLPAQLERAVARANKQAEAAQRCEPRATSDPTTITGPVQNESPNRHAVNEDLEDAERGEADEPAPGA